MNLRNIEFSGLTEDTWIDLKRTGFGQPYIQTSNQEAKTINILQWKGLKPNNVDIEEVCLVITKDTAQYEALPCHDEKIFACQIPAQ